MINLEMGTDEVVIKVEFINFYRFYIAENDKDKIELDSERYNNALLHEKFCERMYYEALDEESNGGTKKRRLDSIGRSDYGY